MTAIFESHVNTDATFFPLRPCVFTCFETTYQNAFQIHSTFCYGMKTEIDKPIPPSEVEWNGAKGIAC